MTGIMTTLDSDRFAWFQLLFQQGFKLRTRLGSSIRTVLCDQIGVENDYLDNRTNKLFLDGKPVDDVDSVIAREGSTLALSAAMPGLVGAAMRKGGLVAGFRHGITRPESDEPFDTREGLFILKLYNVVTKELGPKFREHGIWLNAEELSTLLQGLPDAFWLRCGKVEIDGREVDVHTARDGEWLKKEDLACLRLVTGNGS